MRCELMQMERMEPDERFGSQSGETIRRMNDIRRRMRFERKQMEEELYETVRDQRGD